VSNFAREFSFRILRMHIQYSIRLFASGEIGEIKFRLRDRESDPQSDLQSAVGTDSARGRDSSQLRDAN